MGVERIIDVIDSIQRQDKRIIARLITRIENEVVHTQGILEQLYPLTGKAFVVGMTGPPGVGKSTLVDGLITHLRSLQKTVAVVAIDPSSPFTGGAILGDRVRMTNHALDQGVFIRSMGTRGKQGGVAHCTREVVHVLDAAGYDVIFVETVGVGQAELDVMNLADSVVVVLHPESGDMVQVLKAGIMEVSDVFLINKADLKGADRLEAQVHDMIGLVKTSQEWSPPVLKVVAKNGQGIEEIWESVLLHRAYNQENGDWLKRREEKIQHEVREMITTHIYQHIEKKIQHNEFTANVQEVVARERNPYEIAQKWVSRIIR